MVGKTKASPGQDSLPIDVSGAVEHGTEAVSPGEPGRAGVEEGHALSGAEGASGGGMVVDDAQPADEVAP